MSIKTGLFFFLTFSCIITPISGIINRYCIMENLIKNSGKHKNKLRTIYQKNHEILRAASLEPNFTGSYKQRV